METVAPLDRDAGLSDVTVRLHTDARHDVFNAAQESRGGWIAKLFFGGPVGGLLYLLIAMPKLRRVDQAAAVEIEDDQRGDLVAIDAGDDDIAHQGRAGRGEACA